ncbi:MAG: XdhC family protein [Candidatus Melainabacteria bacterium]|nr:XdhC family protein [Candidatus Melainabacteria bacterium]
MIDTAEILDLYTLANASGHKMVLATVVDVDGSAYRRPGAHLLVTEDGRTAGSISAGCLESDILARHTELFSLQQSTVLQYESDEFFGLNYGCDGTINVLVQPVLPNQINFPTAFTDANKLGRQLILATVYNSETADMIGKKLLASGGRILNSELPPDIERHVAASLFAVERLDRHQCKTYDEIATKVFFEIIKPNLRLVIFGAGDDVIPLIETAKSIGIEVRLSDSRRSYLDRHSERADVFQFSSGANNTTVYKRDNQTPAACEIKSLNADEIELALFDAPQRTAVVIMSHSFELDKRFLQLALEKNSAYLGVVGSRKRTEKLLTELNAMDASHRIHYPIGLDLGSETAKEIALSIVSEILAFFRNASGKPLCEVSGSVHEPRKENGSRRFEFASARHFGEI